MEWNQYIELHLQLNIYKVRKINEEANTQVTSILIINTSRDNTKLIPNAARVFDKIISGCKMIAQHN